MIRSAFNRLGLGIAFCFVLTCDAPVGMAGDCCRQMGVGYSAGYHAPAPFTCSPTCLKLPGWRQWKGACCHPGAPVIGTGCGCEAAPPCGCGPMIAPSCGGCLPSCCPAPCGGCGTRNPGVY